jgi:hypothetical protein
MVILKMDINGKGRGPASEILIGGREDKGKIIRIIAILL